MVERRVELWRSQEECLASPSPSVSWSASRPGGSDATRWKHCPAVLVEPNHRVLVVKGANTWGDERPLRSRFVEYLSAGHPIVVLLVGGGDQSVDEQRHALRRKWPVIALRGSGGLSDHLKRVRSGRRLHIGRREQEAKPSGDSIPRQDWENRSLAVADQSGLRRVVRWLFDSDDFSERHGANLLSSDPFADSSRRRSKQLNAFVLFLVVVSNGIALSVLATVVKPPLPHSRSASLSQRLSEQRHSLGAGRRARDQEWVVVRGLPSAFEVLSKPPPPIFARRSNDVSTRPTWAQDDQMTPAAELAQEMAQSRESCLGPCGRGVSRQESWPLRPSLAAAVHEAGDELSYRLTGDGYVRCRLEHQLAYFERRGSRQDLGWAAIMLTILILVCASTVLVAFASSPTDRVATWLIVAATV